jgi:glutamate-ammonia-ligase adenylyltransferase
MPPEHPDFSLLPDILQEPARTAWQAYTEKAETSDIPILADPVLLVDVPRVWACSQFVAQGLSRHPAVLVDLVQGDLQQAYRGGEINSRVHAALKDASDEADLGKRLRRLRLREMVRITWRDIAGRADLDETLRDLSALAEATIDQALARLYDWQCASAGTPCNNAGVPQRLVVLGMGKLGGSELNFSSDIDLIFAYPEDGETRGGRRAMANSQFFVRLGQQLVKALDTNTADGFVYRVDMRLRPNGSVGPLAISFDAMEVYYQSQGRPWERYAMVKARVVGGDREQGEILLATLRPFVYRRYLDYSAIESLRELKETMRAEVRRKGMENNIKLGSGGIREVEFVVQAQQIIRGGRDAELQTRRLLTVLGKIGDKGLLPAHTVTQLDQAYRFLRILENRIQQIDDRQTQALPDSDLDQSRLVAGMEAEDWEVLMTALGRYRQWVTEAFEQVFAAPQRDDATEDTAGELALVWNAMDDQAAETAEEILTRAGFEDAGVSRERIQALHQHRNLRAMSHVARERLDRLMPLAIGAAAGSNSPDATLDRLIQIIEHIGRRSAYLALLVENPMALGQLVRLCSASAWIANQVAKYPLLLDELIDPRILFAPPRRGGLQAELDRLSADLDPLDLEAQMEMLRRFQASNQLRVAAADIVGALPLMTVSDHLTELAEVTLGGVLRAAWAQLTAKHGRPRCRIDTDDCETGFGIIAYGKLGGIELGYGSDLDIVFVHAGEPGSQTDGDKPLDVNVFFGRLAQRIIHIISTPTAAGFLYETDLRLRPSGASGLLVTSLDALAAYQRDQAWTWEHQALVRARPVAGDTEVGEAFETIRGEVLSRPRDTNKLRGDVRDMREKMREHLGSHQPGSFHIKQDHGGIADIEFLVQYGVLRWSGEYPELRRWTDNIRLLDSFVTTGLMDAERAEQLADAYRTFRSEIHRLPLEDQPPLVPDDTMQELREVVRQQWLEWLHD